MQSEWNGLLRWNKSTHTRVRCCVYLFHEPTQCAHDWITWRKLNWLPFFPFTDYFRIETMNDIFICSIKSNQHIQAGENNDAFFQYFYLLQWIRRMFFSLSVRSFVVFASTQQHPWNKTKKREKNTKHSWYNLLSLAWALINYGRNKL